MEGIVGNRAIESAAIRWIITLERAGKQWTHEFAAALLIFQARLGPLKSKRMGDPRAVRICGWKRPRSRRR